jgi:hypothetical protein
MRILSKTHILLTLILLAVSIAAVSESAVAQSVTASVGADIVSRYNWRGLDLGDGVSIQPTLKCQTGGFKAGFWGSYSSEFTEIDTWAGYTVGLSKSGSLTALLTDYYFPSAGIRYFNFNNYDDSAGAGAHLLEIGLSYSGPETFPLTVSGYMNVYNDAGNNTYFQVDYPFTINDVAMGIFIGGTAGSTENPSFYGTDDAQVINVGLKGTRKLKLSPESEFPVSATFICNPNQEIAYLIFGIGI